MKILIVSPEVYPYAKTGGLADVAGALPKALASLGNDVKVVMPKYGTIDGEKYNLAVEMPEVIVNFSGTRLKGVVKKANFPTTNIPVYFIQRGDFFDRPELYGEKGKDYSDNALRYAFFSMATLWMLRGIDWHPDIIVCNEWQSAFIPIYLRNLEFFRKDPFYNTIKILFTIHNLAYQGLFSPNILEQTGLDWSLFSMNGLEFYGQVNLMKGGIFYSDAVSTVSKQYARGICTHQLGCGLDGVLLYRKNDLYGIMNGIDYSVWNPETDKLIPAHYSPKSLEGKEICKTYLQKISNFPQKKDIPLIGIISRLVDQKGLDIIVEAMNEIMKYDLQMVLLGTGEPKYHKVLSAFQEQYPAKFRASLTFDNLLAHQIEAGADFFLMPSNYEPCGLNQLYSLKYGTVPIVRKTGGLADSIENVTAAALRKGTATGFVFTKYSSTELVKAIKRAINFYNNDKENFKKLMLIGMNKDFSWDKSAKEYMKLFHTLIGKKPR